MQFKTQLLAVLISLTLLTVILLLVYKRRLREEYSLLWLLGASVLLGLSIFRGVLTGVAGFLGIDYAPSLLFAVSALFGLIIMLSHAVVITSLVRRNRDLAQKMALLEWHIDQLELGIRAIARTDREATGERPRRVKPRVRTKERELHR